MTGRCAWLAGLGISVASIAGAQRVVAIEHVTAIPMDRERTIPDATILVEGERIKAVGPSAGISIPAGATRIDGRGLFAAPGFTDMHVHPYDTEGFASYLAHGITTIAVMNGAPQVLDWRARQRSGSLDGPTIYTAGTTVNGVPPGNPMFIAVQDEANARAIARDQKRDGYDFIKAYSFLNENVYAALLDEAHKAGIAVVGHIPFPVGYAGVARARQANIAHIEEFFQTGDVPDDSMPVVAARIKASGATVTANLFAYADYIRTVADINAVLHDPEMRYASPAQYSEKLPTSNRAINRPNPQAFAQFLRDRLVRFRKLLRAFSAAGVPVLVGTDTEIFGFPGESAYQEMVMMGEAGLEPFEVLTSATRNAGEFVARAVPSSEKFGILAPGMRADIVLLRANPLVDLRNASAIAGTMSRGRWYSAGRLTRMRDSVAARTTPERAFVDRFDSLAMKAKDPAAAAKALREFRAANPAAVPIAEGVWLGYGRMLFNQDPAASTEIRAMMRETFPRTFSAANQLARSYLFRFDTTEALRWFRQARDLSPHNFVVTDVIEKLEAAREPPDDAALGRYAFDSIRTTVQGTPRLLSIVVNLARTGSRLSINGDSSIVPAEAVVGKRGIWVTARYAGQDLELRWTNDASGSSSGTWIHGILNNGALRGRRR